MPRLLLTFALSFFASALSIAQNIGIGTTNPSELLHLKDGNLRLDDGYSFQFTTQPGDTAGIRFYNGIGLRGGLLFNTSTNIVNLTKHDTIPGLTYSFSTGRLLLGRNYTLSSAEIFGVTSPSSSWGGMYLETTGGPSGRPFYGYGIQGKPRAYHYYDGSSSQWRLVTGSITRMSVDSTTGDIALHGNTVFVDGVNNRVGIGTYTPGTDLHSMGPIRIEDSSPKLELYSSGVQKGYIRSESNTMEIVNSSVSDFNFITPLDTVVTIDQNGDLGVGTTDPLSQLHVKGVMRVDNTVPQLRFHNGETFTAFIQTSADKMTISNKLSNNMEFRTNNVVRLSLANNGNVGIGIVDPLYRFHSRGSAVFDNPGTVQLQFHNASTPAGQVFGDSDEFGLEDLHGEDGHLIFKTDNTSRLEIDGYGFVTVHEDMNISDMIRVRGSINRVGVGTTTPGATLDVQGSFEVDGITFKINDATNQVLIGTNIGAAGYKLCVDGKIISEEIVVQLSGDWPDYVFAENYELRRPSEIKDFITDNGHLPGVPSATEVSESNEIELGEMNRILLEKIEELTLYIIEQDERIAALESQNNSQNGSHE